MNDRAAGPAEIPHPTTPDSTPTARGMGFDSMLLPGEMVLWQGKPERGPFVWRTWPLSIFGAVLFSAVLVFEVTILTTEAPDVLAAWGIPFTIAALYMLAGHFVITSLEWQNTEYLLTDSRVLVRHGIFSPSLTSYNLHTLPLTQVEMHGSEVGNVMFKPPKGQGYGPGPGYQTMWPYPPGYLVGIMYIRDPRHVQTLIERTRASRFGVRYTDYHAGE